MSKIRDYRLYQHLINIKKDRDQSGMFGEAILRNLLNDMNWRYVDINTADLDILPNDLYLHGGKKPDFISLDDLNGIVIWDAKFHEASSNRFWLRSDEIKKYRILTNRFQKEINYSNDIYTVFFVLPKRHDGKLAYLVELGEIEIGNTEKDDGISIRAVTLRSDQMIDTSKYQRQALISSYDAGRV